MVKKRNEIHKNRQNPVNYRKKLLRGHKFLWVGNLFISFKTNFNLT